MSVDSIIDVVYKFSRGLNTFMSRYSPVKDETLTYRLNFLCPQAERDLSNEYNNYQPGALNTTDRLIEDLANIDLIWHIGDLSYANGYLSEWDQLIEQIAPLSSHVPYMVAR